MCASAIVLVQLPEIGYGASDPVMADVPAWLAQLPFAAGRLPRIDQALTGPARRFAELLPVLHMAQSRRQSRSFATYRAARPDLVARAEQLLADPGASELRGRSCRSAFTLLAGPD